MQKSKKILACLVAVCLTLSFSLIVLADENLLLGASNTDASNTDASNTDASNTDASNTDPDATNTDPIATNTDPGEGDEEDDYIIKADAGFDYKIKGSFLYIKSEGITAEQVNAALGKGCSFNSEDGVAGSGDTIVKDGEVVYTVVIKGDVDGDGNIPFAADEAIGRPTAADARATLRIAVRLDSPSDWQLEAALVLANENVTAAEARAILRAAVGLDDATVWFDAIDAVA